MNRDCVVILEHESALRALGLHTLEGAHGCRGGVLVDDHRGNRDVLRFDILDDQGRPIVLYLKRMWKANLKDGLKSLLRRGRVWSKARTEFENYLAAGARGIRTARPVACGERCSWLSECFSYIVTEAAPGLPLDEWLATHRTAPARAEMLAAVGRFVRSMHDAGIAFPDLFARHIFIDSAQAEPEAWRFSLIDVTRMEFGAFIRTSRRVRDLAMLSLSVPLREVSMRERLACLRGYQGQSTTGRRSTLARRINACVARLLRRERFRRYADAGAGLALCAGAFEWAADSIGLLVGPLF